MTTLRPLDTTPEPTFDRERGEWIAPDGRRLADLTQVELDLLADVGLFAEAAGLDLPWVAEWVPLKMAIRKALVVTGKLTSETVREAVERLDKWAADWGLARHGRLFWDHFGSAHGFGAYFRIVDLQLFMDKNKLVAAGLDGVQVESPGGRA